MIWICTKGHCICGKRGNNRIRFADRASRRAAMSRLLPPPETSPHDSGRRLELPRSGCRRRVAPSPVAQGMPPQNVGSGIGNSTAETPGLWMGQVGGPLALRDGGISPGRRMRRSKRRTFRVGHKRRLPKSSRHPPPLGRNFRPARATRSTNRRAEGVGADLDPQLS
jgi:hypothetical protein